jgi:hypothetical protein
MPSESVTVRNVKPLSGFNAVTPAPLITAPVESVMRPIIFPVAVWLYSAWPMSKEMITIVSKNDR